MKKIDTKFLPLVLMISLLGCKQVTKEDTQTPNTVTEEVVKPMSQREHNIVEKMRWVEKADATSDANAALRTSAKYANGKPELIAFAGRGLTFPGLSHSQYESIKTKVNSRTAQGSGDVIYGNTHKALRKKMHAYASEYNMVIHSAVNERP